MAGPTENGEARRRNRWLAAALLMVVLGAGWTFFSREQVLFRQLQSCRREHDDAERFARQLARSPKGVELAIEDMSLGGGTTMGWSSWIVCNSAPDPAVDRRLSKIADDAQAPFPRRIEALFVLWNRTGEARFLEQWFLLVRPAGGPVTGVGRRRLGHLYDDPSVSPLLETPEGSEVEMSIDRFRAMRPRRTMP